MWGMDALVFGRVATAAFVTWQLGCGLHGARLDYCFSLAGEAFWRSLPWGVAGCSSRRPTRFFAPPKKWGKKGGPYDGGQRCALTARAARN